MRYEKMTRPEEELESLSDSELVARYREGDRMAEEFLLKKYIPLVKKEIRYLYIAGAETDDLSQEAMIGLVKAIRDYDTEGGAAFITYATTCVDNEIRTAIKKSNRMKHQPLNSYISLYTDVVNRETEESDTELIDLLVSDEETDPEYIMLFKERTDTIRERMESELSSMERKVTELYLSGLSYADIAERLGKTEQSVTNALSRARAKLKKDSE